MAQMCHCSYLMHSKITFTPTPVCNRYDLYSRKPFMDRYGVSSVELRANLGRQIVSELPAKFRIENNGRFIAVAYTGKVLAVRNTLEALNKEIAEKHLKENYYIERLGHSTITQI